MKFNNRCFLCFAALSTPARVEIVKLLQGSTKMSVLEIAKNFKLTQPTITYHLKYLEEAGILTSQKKGKNVFYSLEPVCSETQCQIF